MWWTWPQTIVTLKKWESGHDQTSEHLVWPPSIPSGMSILASLPIPLEQPVSSRGSFDCDENEVGELCHYYNSGDLPRVFFLGGLSPRMRITHTVAHWRLRGALLTVWGQQECPAETGPKCHQGEKETRLRRIKIWVNLTHWFWIFFETMYIQIEEPAPPHYVHHQRMYQKMP